MVVEALKLLIEILLYYNIKLIILGRWQHEAGQRRSGKEEGRMGWLMMMRNLPRTGRWSLPVMPTSLYWMH